MEQLKSLVLAALVLFSVYQSYLLVFSKPEYEIVRKSEYVQTEVLGTPKTMEELLFPSEIILHFGNEKHTVLYPNETIFYDMILNHIKDRTFDGLRRSSIFASSFQWEEIRRSHQGLELHFREGVPLSVLQRFLRIRGELPEETQNITKIWIYRNDNSEEVRTFFFTSNSNVVYEVSKADFNMNVDRLVKLGEYLTTYTSINNGEYYVPDQPLSILAWQIPYELITPDQLQSLLFVDPGNTRNFPQRDGSEIYTDGKRGLTVKNEKHWMQYIDPIPSVDQDNVVEGNLLSAIQFVNQHGGWSGDHLIESIPESPIIGRQTFLFRQYFDAYPVVDTGSEPFGLTRVVIQKEVVSGYERSILTLDPARATPIEGEAVILPGGQSLEDLIANYPNKASIMAIFPAYRPYVIEDHVQLRPGWAIQLLDGSLEYL